MAVVPVGCLKVPDDFSEEPNAEASAPTTAAEVLDRHIASVGGREALEKLQSRTVDARIVFRADPNCEEGDENCPSEDQSGSFVLTNTADSRLYRRTVLGDLVEERGFDGKLGWQLQDGTYLQLDTEAEAVISKEDAVLHWYFDIPKRDIETTLVSPREVEIDGETRILDGIEWRLPGATPKTMWFDRSTGLRREEIVERGEGEQRAAQRIVYADYREVDGVLVPHHIQVINEIGEQTEVVEFFTQQVTHEPIEAQKFEVPELPDPEPVADRRAAAFLAAKKEASENPDDVTAQMGYARMAFGMGAFKEAEEALQATLKLDGNEPEALLTLARVQILKGRLDEALATLKRAEKAGIRPQSIAQQRAWVYFRRRNFDALADALDEGGDGVQAGRYRSFVGKPLEAEIEGKDCVIEVPLSTTQPLAIVDIQVGDQTVGAILDTGASDIILTESLAEDLDVTVRARSEAMEGLPQVGHGQIDAVTLGGLTLKNVPVNIFADAAVGEMVGPDGPKNVRAVIGMAALSEFQITVGKPEGSLTLIAPGRRCNSARQARRSETFVPFVVQETHYIYVPARMEGAPGIYLVNTGMRGADLTANDQAFAHAGIGAPPMRSDRTPMAKVEAFALGDALTVKDVEAAYGFFQQNATSDGFRLDGMIGLGVLGRQPFTIDYETQRIYVHPGSPAAESKQP